jgi:hypothetical protein
MPAAYYYCLRCKRSYRQERYTGRCRVTCCKREMQLLGLGLEGRRKLLEREQEDERHEDFEA